MSPKINADVCVRCKGSKMLCGLKRCPIVERIGFSGRLNFGRLIDGFTPPSSLVSERGYPRVLVGPTVSQIEPDLPENPKFWISKDLSYIIARFSSQVYANFRSYIRNVEDPRVEELRFSVMSYSPVGINVELAKVPKPRVSFDGILAPIGPSAPAERIKLTENPKIPSSLERAFYDSDVRASEIIWETYKRGVDVYTISKILSLGGLGNRARRKLVPTKWAITATDSIIGDFLRREIEYSPIYSGEVMLFQSNYEGNRYFILIAPGPYMLEIVEAWMPRGLWTKGSDEPVVMLNSEIGRLGLEYMDGGHYAMRLAILEKLADMKRQAAVIAIREIGPEYYAPVGVWQVREGMRAALRSEPLKFPELGDAMSHLKLKFDFNLLIRSLRIPKILRGWVSLEGFFENP